MEDLLKNGARALGVELTEAQIEQFLIYTQLLLEWNEKFNLTSIIDPDEIAVKHFVDSLACLSVVNIPNGAEVADVGTGAGFPGVPLAIVRPDIKVTLIEATKKKLTFLEAVCDGLAELNDGIKPNIELVHARAEDVGIHSAFRESFDIVTARAVAELRILAEYCLPLVKPGGTFIAMKGPDVETELHNAKPGIGTLGGGPPEVKKLTLPGTDMCRSIITIKKVKHTPDQFPRHGSKISQKPL